MHVSRKYLLHFFIMNLRQMQEDKCKFQINNRQVKTLFLINNSIFNLWVIDDTRNNFGFYQF